MIVKLQIEAFPKANEELKMLVYDRNRTVFYQSVASPQILKEMRGRLKAYFYAKMQGTVLNIGQQAPEQEW